VLTVYLDFMDDKNWLHSALTVNKVASWVLVASVGLWMHQPNRLARVVSIMCCAGYNLLTGCLLRCFGCDLGTSHSTKAE